MASKRYTKEQFIEAVKNGHSYAEVCRILGLSPRGGNLNTVKRKIQELQLDMSHFTGARWNKGLKAGEHPGIRAKSIEEILVENSGWTSHNIRNKLLDLGIKEHKCEICGNTEWLGFPIPLELHHINGVHTDNRLENLQILCPNCHAQTDNYSGKKVLSAQNESSEVEVG